MAEARRRRSPRSLRAEYDEFIQQRIEEYKDTLPRADILRIGDEAALELAGSDQYQLTELLLLEQVDAIIRRRLKLPPYRRWREKHRALRAAQQQPTHWGFAPHAPVAALADALEEQEQVLVVGAADGASALYLAALGAQVTVVDGDLAAVEGVENRAGAEALAARVNALVIPLAGWAPAQPVRACVIEPAALTALSSAERSALVTRLKEATLIGGRHAVMPSAPRVANGGMVLSSDALRTLYADWRIERPGAARGGGGVFGGSGSRRARNAGFTAVRPEARQNDTAGDVSE